MSEETVQTPTFDQAAEAAAATLAKEVPAVDEVTDETNADTDTTQEQTQAETPADAPAETDELLSDEEVATLDVNGQANYKKMQKAFTEKTQKLAAERKEMEAYRDLIKSYQTDPKETIKKLAQQHGLSLAEAAQLVKQEPVKVTPEESEVTRTQLRQLLGEGNEELADGLAKIIDSRAEQIAGSRVKPIEDRQADITRRAAQEAADADLKAFEKSHPDFKTYEPAMRELSTKIQPAEGAKMDVSEYLEMLYKVASLKDSEATQTKKVIDRINKAASSSESKESAIPTNKVTPARPKAPTLEEAFEAAKKGIAW
jgi:hypothetical protein